MVDDGGDAMSGSARRRLCSALLLLVALLTFQLVFESPTGAGQSVAQMPMVTVTTTTTATATALTTSTATSTTATTVTTPTTVMMYTNFATTTITSTLVTTVTYADLSVNFDKPYPATYNPGETVHINGGFSTPYCTWTYTSGGQGSGLVVDIAIYGPSGSLVGGATTSPAAAGYKAYAYDYVLSASAAAGTYDVVVSYHYPCGGFIVYGNARFFVASSVTCSTVTTFPAWGITISTDKSVYGSSDTVQIAGTVSGGPGCYCPCGATCTCAFTSYIVVQLMIMSALRTVYTKTLTLSAYPSGRPYTDSFSLSSGLESGNYQVVARASYSGYPTVEASSSFQLQGTATTIVVTSPATTTEWTWTVSGMGGIEGRVMGLDIFGNRVALAGAGVEAKGQQTFTAQTGEDGSFHLTVPPDNYVVTASANGYAPKSGSVFIAEGWKASIDFLLTPTVTVSTVVTTTVSPATTLTTLVASTTLSTVVTVYTTMGTGGTVTALVQGLVMQVSSNSSVSSFVFDSSRSLLNFTVSGPAGTQGFFDAAVAKSLLLGQPVVLIDGVEHTASVTEDADYWYIHVTYPHSAHHVAIGGSNTIPEFPSIAMLTAVFVFAIIVFKRRTRCVTRDSIAQSNNDSHLRSLILIL